MQKNNCSISIVLALLGKMTILTFFTVRWPDFSRYCPQNHILRGTCIDSPLNSVQNIGRIDSKKVFIKFCGLKRHAMSNIEKTDHLFAHYYRQMFQLATHLKKRTVLSPLYLAKQRLISASIFDVETA